MPKSVSGVMREYQRGELHSGSSAGPVVKSRQQALAIAMSEQRTTPHPNKNLGGYLHPKKSR